jgi:glyoxylase-like metal-dependent hydrolase (beta-lactamase superfamily II)
MIDTGTGSYFPVIKENFENSGFNPRTIQTIVDTHCHFDHTGGNKKFRDLCRAKIFIHKADQKALENGHGTMAENFNESPKVVTVDKALREGDVIKTRNYSWKVLSTPGHTPGSICLYDEKRRVLISGDTVFADGIGRTDMQGGDDKAMKESIRKLSGLKVDYILPGHGMPKMNGAEFLFKQILAKMK